nr:MAG TPA: hypothetical protein [Caudoviricetes sp.]
MKIKVFHITTKGFIYFNNKKEYIRFVSDITHRAINENTTIRNLARMLPKEEYCTIFKGGLTI